jgi:hypothetical protein
MLTVVKQSAKWLIRFSNLRWRDDSGEALRIGIYIIFLEAINEGSGVVENVKTVVVVARKL